MDNTDIHEAAHVQWVLGRTIAPDKVQDLPDQVQELDCFEAKNDQTVVEKIGPHSVHSIATENLRAS